MKGSEIRKRYILLYSQKMYSILPSLEKDLFRAFHSKKKFAEGVYSIFLANQLNKDQFIEFIREKYPMVTSIVTSGTIRKCKSVREKHRQSIQNGEVEISTLL